jgi:hypothetical protein
LVDQAACEQVLRQRVGTWLGDCQTITAIARQARVEGFEQPLFTSGAKAMQFANAMRRRSPSQLIQRCDAQFVLQHTGPLWTKVRQSEQLQHVRWNLGAHACEHGTASRFDNLAHLCREVDSDTRQGGQVGAARQHGVNAFRHAFNHAGSIAVSAHPKRVGLLNLQQISDFVEDRGDGLVCGGLKGSSGQWHGSSSCVHVVPSLHLAKPGPCGTSNERMALLDHDTLSNRLARDQPGKRAQPYREQRSGVLS